MRITNTMLVNNMKNYIGNNLGRMDKLQSQLATGKKIQVPSDDPVVAARALKLRTDVSEVAQYQRNIKDAQSWLDITESTLSNVNDVFQRARELAVKAANGTNTPEDTQKIEQEVKQLKNQTIHLANTTYAGRYIFSGFKTDTKLMNDDENSPDFGKFAIDVNTIDEKIKYEIGIGDDININVPGGDMFNVGGNAAGAKKGVTSGNSTVSSLDIQAGVNDVLNLDVDGENISINIAPGIYPDSSALAAQIQSQINGTSVTAADITVSVTANTLKFTSGSKGANSHVSIDGTSSAAANLGVDAAVQTDGVDAEEGSVIGFFNEFITALHSGDSTALSQLIGKVDVEINNLLRVRADVGARQNRLELTGNRLDSDNINFTKLMSENEDVDMAETIMNLQSEENVYKASLSGGARIIQPSLVDFLK